MDHLAKPTSNEEMEDDPCVITLEEFIEEETRLETDANAVLGPSDDKNCTYNQGYMGRQALYACKTCKSEDGAKVTGVCLACTYHCHEGHDLIELYTKRNFRCDCGNSRFKNKKCNLEPVKDKENVLNSYNDNFEGLYCTCKRPYPDPEDRVPDEMIQCIICEDWYHTRHLHADLPPEESYAEMICADCSERLFFLNKYIGHSVTSVTKEENSNVDVVKNGASCQINAHPSDSAVVMTNAADTTQSVPNKAIVENDETVVKDINEVSSSDCPNVPNNDNKSEDLTNCVTSMPSTCSQSEQPETTSEKNSDAEKSTGCLLDTLKEVKREKKSSTFWPHNFRSILCTCDSCKEMYSKLGVSFLVESSDTVQSYEEKGKSSHSVTDSSKDSLDRVLGMLSNIGMDRFSQAEAILNYNDLKSNLRDYLSKFVENKKVVREEDIREFFTQMNARKRQKLDLPYMCR